MYHDTIHIKFRYNKTDDIDFDYSFFISKTNQNKFSSVNYGVLLEKFSDIGFNLKYLKFNDLELNSDIYCTYNYQPNFDIFFSAYKKIIHKKKFNFSYEYGNIINGVFIQNNMTTFSSVSFIDINWAHELHISNIEDVNLDIIKDKLFYKTREKYQIIDKNGISIADEITDADSDFEQHFFERYDVKVALRKYKLNRLMQFED